MKFENQLIFPKDLNQRGCKWVFKTKKYYKDRINRYKARLAAIEFTQREGYYNKISSKGSFRVILFYYVF